MNRIIRRALNQLQEPAPAYGPMAVRDRFADMRARLTTDKPVIVDGGGEVGRMTAAFLEHHPHAHIHVFEPRPSAVATLQERFGGLPNVTIHAQAIGAETGTILFNVVNNAHSSSVLQPSTINHRYHPQEMDVAERIEVPLVRLDEVLSGEIDILKLDLQGYELEALKGAAGILPHIKMITAEVEFVPLYDDQPLFADIDQFLRQREFHLLNLYELWTHPDGQLTSGDAVYLNTRYYGTR